MSAGTFGGWEVDVELRTPAFPPPGRGWKTLALKGDGVLMVAHRLRAKPGDGSSMK